MRKVKRKFAVNIAFAMMLIILGGCSKPTAKVTFVDYTGKMPSGDFGTVKYFTDRPGYKGVEVTLTIMDFGNITNIADQKDVQKVSEYLVKYASLRNKAKGFNDTQYYYLYYSDSFKSGSVCKLTLYYLVPPEFANETLCFVFDYPDGNIMIEEPCNLFN